MNRQVITQLTTAERLTLFEQIFASQGERSRVEFASCVLSDMAFMFDFANANLVEIKWSKDECELGEIIERINHLLSPETEQKFELGMPYFIHAILPLEPILAQKVIHWLQYDEPIAMEHFVTISDTDDITIRVALIKNEIGNKIADDIEKDNRIINI
ncbi:MAG: hypothetical protein J6X22_00760 [Muribaculaceae bacterium]|nr:hypothetical protein [Muribaculaceae bacterium]